MHRFYTLFSHMCRYTVQHRNDTFASLAWHSVFRPHAITGKIMVYKVKLSSLCSSWKCMGEVEVYRHLFLTSALGGGEWSASRPGAVSPRKYPLVLRPPLPTGDWIVCWMGLGPSLDVSEEKCLCTCWESKRVVQPRSTGTVPIAVILQHSSLLCLVI
jgi:hypothetical protein